MKKVDSSEDIVSSAMTAMKIIRKNVKDVEKDIG